MRSKRLAALLCAVLLGCSDATGVSLIDYFLTYCGSTPAFVAIQTANGGAWTKVDLDGTAAATVKLGDKFGLATVWGSSNSFSTYISYVTKNELPSATANSCAAPGTKSINGSIVALASGREAQVSMENSSAYLSAGGTTNFTLNGLSTGGKDVIAQQRVISTGAEEKVIVRRGQDIANGASLPVLDFGAVEAATTPSATVTITGVAPSEGRSLYNRVYTANGTDAFFNSPAATNTSGTIFGLTSAQTVSTDVFSAGISLIAIGNSRGMARYSKTFGAATLAVGPALSTPTITAAATNPRRLKLQLPSQPEYGAGVELVYYQSSGGAYRSMAVLITSGYLGGTPTTWTVEGPDLSAVTGLPANAVFLSAVTAGWTVYAYGSMADYFAPEISVPDGTISRWAMRGSTAPADQPALRATDPMSPPRAVSQALRRR